MATVARIVIEPIGARDNPAGYSIQAEVDYADSREGVDASEDPQAIELVHELAARLVWLADRQRHVEQ